MKLVRRLLASHAAAPDTRSDDRSRFFRLGVAVYVVLAIVLLLLAVKPQLKSFLNRDVEMTAVFSGQYKLRANDSSVKVAGITVGTVTDIDDTDDHHVLVTMKIDRDVYDKLGSSPTAEIEPRTLLGGRYAIDLHPSGSGEFAGAIPLEHTKLPVELDSILEALPENARTALQGVVGSAGATLHNSQDQLADLLDTAPRVLGPGAGVVSALRGEHPTTDLDRAVRGLDVTARALGGRDDELDGIVAHLDTTTATLAQHRNELAVVLHELPETLRGSRRGISGLADSVDRLETTARSLRPSAPLVDDLLAELQPTLRTAGPVLRDLVPTLRQARPAVRELIPVAEQVTGVLHDLRGPVLDRVNGPVADFLLNPWVGTGAYSHSAKGYQADHKVYEELAYMATNIDRASMGQDSRGSTLAFQAGVGLNSVDGLPFDLDSLVTMALDNAGISDPALRQTVRRNAGLTR